MWVAVYLTHVQHEAIKNYQLGLSTQPIPSAARERPAEGAASSSCRPLVIVTRDKPQARVTRAMPAWPCVALHWPRPLVQIRPQTCHLVSQGPAWVTAPTYARYAHL
jgi:hypothetical protein